MNNSDQDQRRVPPSRLPRRVVILGDGVTAWMAAALMGRYFRRLDCLLTVFAGGDRPEADDSIEAGPAFLGLLQNLGLEIQKVVEHCEGAFRLGTRFRDWVAEDRDFWIPEQSAWPAVGRLNLFDAWFSERSAGRLLRPLHAYSPHWTAGQAGKAPLSFQGQTLFDQTREFGLNLRSSLLRDFFRCVALEAGVQEIQGTPARCAGNGRGGLAQVIPAEGRAVPADFFVETRPFSDRLPMVPGAEWESWSDCLPGDTQMITWQLHQESPPVFSDRRMTSTGWLNVTPLHKHSRFVFNYDGASVSEDDALSALGRVEGGLASGQTDIVIRKTIPGRRTVAWKDNVVALGPAAGCCGYLLNSDLQAAQVGLELFMELFPGRSGNPAAVAEYNDRMTVIWEEFRDAASMLFHSVRRPPQADRPDFRKAAAESLLSGPMARRRDVYRKTGHIRSLLPESLPSAFWQYLFAGVGIQPQRIAASVHLQEPAETHQILRGILQEHKEITEGLSDHGEMLSWIHSDLSSGALV